MHELAICRALIDRVAELAGNSGARRVCKITLDVGPLSGVVPDLLVNAFPVASAGTVAEGASLTIDAVPVRVWCNSCQTESDARVNCLVCAKCGAWRTVLRSGNELLLRSVVLEDGNPTPIFAEPEGTRHV